MDLEDMISSAGSVFDGNGIQRFEEPMTLFYDESGNCRKFVLTENGVNSEDALHGDFVLAGVAFEGTKQQTDFSALYKALNYQEGQKELKFRHLYKGCKDFDALMQNKRTTDFLQWLEESGLYVHYSALNNLYYSLVDIVDSLWELFPQCIPYFFKIKSALYDFTIDTRDEILDLLFRYEYPNITKCREFCYELCDFLYAYNNDDTDYPGFYLELLRQMLKTAGKEESLIFVQDNEPYILNQEYEILYRERCETFCNSQHYFDEEPAIEKAFSKLGPYDGKNPLHNYAFMKSHENLYIQISDIVAGLLRRLFMYLDDHGNDEIAEISEKLSSEDGRNYRRIWDMLLKADTKTPLLIKNLNSPKNCMDRTSKLQKLAHIDTAAERKVPAQS